MFKTNKYKELINNELLIREPVDIFLKNINNNNSKTIILTGEKGCGKSTVLHTLEQKNIGTNNQAIYMIFDSYVLFSNNNKELYNKTFLKHYYELTFSWKLLSYIKRNYKLTYEKHFKEIENLLSNISKNTDKYINNIYYNNTALVRYLSPQEISKIIIKKLKEELNIEELTLIIDKFDWTNGSDILSQITIKEFFNMFEKTIITTDDQNINTQNNHSYMNVNYGTDLETIKQIIKERIYLYNKTKDKELNIFDVEISNDIFEYLIKMTNGNISLALDITKEALDSWQWNYWSLNYPYKTNLEKIFKEAAEHQIEISKNMKKLTKSKKLYI